MRKMLLLNIANILSCLVGLLEKNVVESVAQPFSVLSWIGRFHPLLLKLLCFCRSADEAMVRLQHKVSDSLKQALAKLKLTENASETKGETTNASWPLLSRLVWILICSYWGFVLTCIIHSFEEEVEVHFFAFLFLEEDGDEVKIGTSCKNGGCIKVSETFSSLVGVFAKNRDICCSFVQIHAVKLN